MRYDAERCDEHVVGSAGELDIPPVASGTIWINIDGLGDARELEAVGEALGLHRLTLSDIAHVHQRPKVEPFENYTYLVTRMRVPGRLRESEQVSIVLGTNWVLSVQERAGDVFDPVRERVRLGRGQVRASGADYLASLLLDAVVDHYFPVLDQIGEEIERLEEVVLLHPDRGVINEMHIVRRALLEVRRVLVPQRDALTILLREASPHISPELRIYFRDVYDHCVQLMDMVEISRELAQGLMDVYLSAMSNRMNEIMKVLTVIATVFIPLTFIAGVYGMNFDPDTSPWNMPELRWRFGYPLALLTMAVATAGMLVYFRRKGWLGAGGRAHDRGPGDPPPE
jgi:magnesium transporter